MNTEKDIFTPLKGGDIVYQIFTDDNIGCYTALWCATSKLLVREVQ